MAALAASPAQANPWLERRVLDMAHQGGEWTWPSNTIYSYTRAVRAGSDMLELDVHPTADGRLVALHDATVDRTTNGHGQVREMTLRQVQRLDAAYNFIPRRNAVPGQPPSSYPLRGVRTGRKPPPRGFRPRDFRIPTLAEIFRRFPRIPINIEIKGRSDADVDSYLENARLLAAFLNRTGRRNVIVVSFHQEATDYFHSLAPQVALAPGITGVAGFYFSSAPPGAPPGEGYVAMQIPTEFSGIEVATPDFINRAHSAGYAVHVYLGESEENAAVYRRLIDDCVDGIMTAYPLRFERWLRQNRIAGPGRQGVDPCGG